MSVIINIDGVPLFNTKIEARIWADKNGLTGFHEHTHQDVVGYMGGDNHSIARQTIGINNFNLRNNTSQSTTPPQTATPPPTITPIIVPIIAPIPPALETTPTIPPTQTTPTLPIIEGDEGRY